MSYLKYIHSDIKLLLRWLALLVSTTHFLFIFSQINHFLWNMTSSGMNVMTYFLLSHILQVCLVFTLSDFIIVKVIFLLFSGHIQENSPAARCGRLHVGDRILAVNGVDTTTMHHKDVVSLIKDSGFSVALTVGPPAGQFSVPLCITSAFWSCRCTDVSQRFLASHFN